MVKSKDTLEPMSLRLELIKNGFQPVSDSNFDGAGSGSSWKLEPLSQNYAIIHPRSRGSRNG